MCVEGLDLMYDFCQKHNVPTKKVGKLIVAVTEEEIPGLERLLESGKQNKVRDLEMIDAKGIKEREPHCQGVRALLSPHTGIVDYTLVTQAMAQSVKENHGQVLLNFEVNGFHSEDEQLSITAKDGRKIKCRGTVIIQ